MKKFVLMGVAALALLCTSCGTSRQSSSNVNLAQTNVVLSKKNYKIIGYATGESKQNYWFGFGGLSQKSMADAAVSDMYRNANLTGSQAVINVNVSYKSKMILIYSATTCYAQGTVIEFTE